MSAFYDELATVARDLLREFGQPIVFTRVTGEVRNPANGAVIKPGTTATLTANGLVVPIKAHLIDGTRIKASDKVLILDDTFEPLMTDKVEGWAIQEIESKAPAGTPLVYFVRVRK
jgi:hypothetical protein